MRGNRDSYLPWLASLKELVANRLKIERMITCIRQICAENTYQPFVSLQSNRSARKTIKPLMKRVGFIPVYLSGTT